MTKSFVLGKIDSKKIDDRNNSKTSRKISVFTKCHVQIKKKIFTRKKSNSKIIISSR